MLGRKKAALIGGAATLLIGTLAAVVLLRPGSTGGAPLLTVRSRPSGAKLLIADVELGTTPYFGDNRFGPGPVKIQLSLPGYRDWHGQFDGGAEVALDVPLSRPQPNVAVERVEVHVVDAGEWSDPDLEDEAKAMAR